MLSKIGLLTAACALTLFSAGTADAAYTITFAQVGNNVVATGTGTLNVTGLSLLLQDTDVAQIWPGRGWALVGNPAADLYSTNISFSGSFGSGGDTNATTSSGGLTGIFGTAPYVLVPTGYKSGSLTTSTSTFANATFQSLGLFGSATATFNSGVNADTITVLVPALASAVPEAATWAMMMVGLGVVGGSLRRRRSVSTRVSFA